jgi:ubiquinone/menaquinone biosynthesis C-methylase UbiE
MEPRKFTTFAQYYDQIYATRLKAYEQEAALLRQIIREHEHHPARTLLDVGCGTGSHLQHLADTFECTGVDLNPHMIAIATRKVPRATFVVADMVHLQLTTRFDVVTCLFSSIGYVQTLPNLITTLHGFHTHLQPHGFVIVEPWVFKTDYKPDTISLDTVEEDNLKVARIATSHLTSTQWLVDMHYLIGANGTIRYLKERHTLALLDYEDYMRAFDDVRFREVTYLTTGLWDGCRGLFVARK